MAAPDCDLCALMNYRSCDTCGNPIFDRWRSPMGVELCADCRQAA